MQAIQLIFLKCSFMKINLFYQRLTNIPPLIEVVLIEKWLELS